MKRVLIAMLVAAVSATVVEPASAAQVEGAIKEVLGKLDRCFASNDAACVGGLFVEDATYVAPQGEAKIVKGKAQIVKAIAPAMEALNKRGGKLTHALENVRMIDDAHALIDVTIAVRGPDGPVKQDDPAHQDQYRSVGLMVLEGGKWLCADLRSYVIGYTTRSAPPPAPDKDAAPAPENAPSPPATGEPASPTQG